jgi:hypothetical protein
VRDQRAQLAVILAPVLGYQPGDAEPPATLAAPARHLEHGHALVGHVAEGIDGFHRREQ